MLVKVSDLTDAALDWAVIAARTGEMPEYKTLLNRREDGNHVGYSLSVRRANGDFTTESPSSRWANGGPVVDEIISCGGRISEGDFIPGVVAMNIRRNLRQHGSTVLEAAARLCVVSVLGESVDIPDALASVLPREKILNLSPFRVSTYEVTTVGFNGILSKRLATFNAEQAAAAGSELHPEGVGFGVAHLILESLRQQNPKDYFAIPLDPNMRAAEIEEPQPIRERHR